MKKLLLFLFLLVLVAGAKTQDSSRVYYLSSSPFLWTLDTNYFTVKPWGSFIVNKDTNYNDYEISDLKPHYIAEVESSSLRMVNYTVTLKTRLYYSYINNDVDSVVVLNIIFVEPFYFYSKDEFDDWVKALQNTIQLHYEIWLKSETISISNTRRVK